MDMIERTGEYIRKFKALIPTVEKAEDRVRLTLVSDSLESIYAVIVKNNLPCPPHMIAELERLFSFIEKWYVEMAAN